MKETVNDAQKLRVAVETVNTHNRPYAHPLIYIVECDMCGKEFASQVQDNTQHKRRICSKPVCQNAARRGRT